MSDAINKVADTLKPVIDTTVTKSVEAVKADVTKSVEAVKVEVNSLVEGLNKRLDELSAQMTARPMTATKSADSTGVDWSKFSIAKAISAMASRDWTNAKYEREVSGDLCKEWYSQKALSLGNDASAGYLVPPQFLRDQLIPLLRSQLVFDRLNVTRFPGLVNSPVQIPRQRTAATGYWVGESSSVNTSDQSLDLLSMVPHKGGAATKITNTLLRKSPSAAEDFVRRDLAEILQRLMENAFFEGTGSSGQPRGLMYDPAAGNIGVAVTDQNVDFSATTDGATIITKAQQMIQLIETRNGRINNLAWVMHPKVWHKILQIQKPEAANGGTPYVGNPIVSGSVVTGDGITTARTLFGYEVVTTTNLATSSPAGTSNRSAIYLADYRDTAFADWGPVELRVTTEGQTLALADTTLVTAFQEMDVGILHPESVCVGLNFNIA